MHMSEAEPEESMRPAKSAIGTVQMLAICVAQLNEAIQITMPYTVAVFMVREFQSRSNPSKDNEQAVGRLTGILAACFCAAQFLSSFPWGRVSDRLGRKPMLIMSNLSSCISVIAFGLAPTYGLAAVFRLAGGLFNCTFVCLKSMIGESCDIKQQARPLSILSLCWGLGTVIGPSLGGALSRPCDSFGHHFPFCSDGQLLRTRPFFLPCFAVGSISFIAFLSSMFCMTETLPKIVARKYAALETVDVATDEGPETELTGLRQPGAVASPWVGQEQPDMEEGHFLGMESSSGKPGPEQPSLLARTDTASQLSGTSGRGKEVAGAAKGGPAWQEGEGEGLLPLVDRGRDGVADEFTPREGYSRSGEAAEGGTGVVWYRDKEPVLTILGYVCVCLLYNLLDEITPIYSSARRSNGGLALSTSQLAWPLAVGGISIFVWSMFFYPMYQEFFGVRNACRLGLLLTMPLCLGLAVPSLLPLPALGMQIILATVLFFKNINATNSFTSAVIMVNAAAPKDAMGAVNGASQAAASFVRAVGPALGGVLWAASVSINISGHQLLAFGITTCGYLVPLFIYSIIKVPNLDGPKR